MPVTASSMELVIYPTTTDVDIEIIAYAHEVTLGTLYFKNTTSAAYTAKAT